MIKIINKIIFAFLLGIVFAFYIIQNNSDFKLIFKKKIKELAGEILDCDFECEIKNINLFFPILELENVFVKDKKDSDDWSWSCKKLKVKCSWYDFIFLKKFKSDVEIYKYNAKTILVNGNLAILPHLKKFIFVDKSNIPISIKSLILNKSNIKVYETELGINTSLDFKCELKKIDNYAKIIIYLTKGQILNDEQTFTDEISGSVQVNIFQNSKIIMEVNGSCDLPPLNGQNNKCYFYGKWNENIRLLQISTIDGKLNIGPINIYKKDNKLNLDLVFQAPVSYIQKMLKLNINADIQGDCLINLTTDLKKENLNGQCLIKNLNFLTQKASLIDELKVDFNKKNKCWEGTVSVDKNNEFQLTGNWFLKESDKENTNIEANYCCKIINHKLAKSNEISGQIDLFKNLTLKSQGFLDKNKYKLECSLNPKLVLRNFSYSSDNDIEYLRVSSDEFNKIKINANFDYLKNWIPDSIKQCFYGQGEIILEGKYLNDKFNGTINSKKINFTVPNTHNIINDIRGYIFIDFHEKKITLKNCNVGMHKGSLKCNNIVLIFDDWLNLSPKFIHLPVSIKNCFINFKKDIFASLSGRIFLLRKVNESKLNVSGYLLIDNAQIKNNIFSDEFRNELFRANYSELSKKIENDLHLNIAILSKNLIKVKTPFLNTKIDLDLRLLNNIANPEISGHIELSEGTISFPYKCLHIKNGNIHFLQNQTYDPIINLTAKNKIKKYNITMHVTGSASSHVIKFESSPPLTDEQIISLLLVGSENGSMNMLMPALVMQNIKNIILGSSQIHTKTKKYFDALLKPLRYINFVPSFNNETGRGGITGTVEVNVNDRFRASIQKGFTFAEDTRFEFDYNVTDEISLKTVKDERGDLAGEIEMRWKF